MNCNWFEDLDQVPHTVGARILQVWFNNVASCGTHLFFSLEGQQDNPAAGFVACCRLLLICRNFLSRISLVSSQGEGFPMPGVLLGNGLPGYFPLILLRDTVQGCSCLNCCSHFITRGEEARNPSLKSPHSAFQQEFFKHKFAFLLNFNFFGGIQDLSDCQLGIFSPVLLKSFCFPDTGHPVRFQFYNARGRGSWRIAALFFGPFLAWLDDSQQISI